MSKIHVYKSAVLDYLKSEKEAYQHDIECHKHMTYDEKEDLGFLIRNAKITESNGNEFHFSVIINNTKLRPGDKVKLKDENRHICYDAIVVENGFESVDLLCNYPLEKQSVFSIEIVEGVFLDSIIALTEQIEECTPGYAFLQQLFGELEPISSGFYGINIDDSDLKRFNDQQIEVCKAVLKRPSIYCIQGPPGTGKTDVLATIAILFSKKGKDVLIISNTHQAINNALNKIAGRINNFSLVKIGEELKSQELDCHIMVMKSYNEYLKYRKSLNTKVKAGSVVGMTLNSAIINLGLRQSGFKPSVVLVDEASQMPFAESVCIGAFGCGSVVFIGDDKQMPPIFHESLKNHPFSKSIFSSICDKYPHLKGKLRITYRMNDEITEYVSKRFYEPYGERLISSDISKNKKLVLSTVCSDDKIKTILKNEKSIHFFNVSDKCDWEDYNIEEAQFIALLIKEAFACGLDAKDLAVITPYRKQVRTIREYVKEVLCTEELPLIDTVERLQGQDVKMIIVSFSVTSRDYYLSNAEFLLMPNRLNVMISRAKQKVVVLGPDFLLDEIKK